jgi:hypothetical protein
VKRFIASLLLLLLSGLLQAQSVNGILDEVYPIKNTIVVNGVGYKADLEHVAIYYNQRRISIQDLTPGDELNLVLNGPQNGIAQKEIKTIIVIRAQKLGLGG